MHGLLKWGGHEAARILGLGYVGAGGLLGVKSGFVGDC